VTGVARVAGVIGVKGVTRVLLVLPSTGAERTDDALQTRQTNNVR